MSLEPESSLPKSIDVLIIGAGAAGLMCALIASQRGRKVYVLEHANKVGKKILMSGGGRCNFTNIHTSPNNFISKNNKFCKSALSRYTPDDFISLVKHHNIPFHEKKLGQLFCDNKSKDILEMLLNECHKAGARIRTHCSISKIEPGQDKFIIHSNLGNIECQSLVVATGGLSIPTMGATGFGYDLARQFGIKVSATRAGLVPVILNQHSMDKLSKLSGSSIEVEVSCNKMAFNEMMLFTHRGLSGPAILQISSYWKPGESIEIDLLPHIQVIDVLLDRQKTRPKAELKTILAELMTKKIAQTLIELWFGNIYNNKPINQISSSDLKLISRHIHHWIVTPSGSEGYRTAEVTLGGVDCNEISSKTMESNKQKGLYFIGEVLDVTGHLGGFNFQWAWASGSAAGEFV